MQFQEKQMLLVLQQGYHLGTRSICFSWNCKMTIYVRKKDYTHVFIGGCHRKCTQMYTRFVQKSPLTDRQIVPFWPILVPLGLEHICRNKPPKLARDQHWQEQHESSTLQVVHWCTGTWPRNLQLRSFVMCSENELLQSCFQFEFHLVQSNLLDAS